MSQGKVGEVVAMLKAIHAQEDREEAEIKAAAVIEKLESMKRGRAAQIAREGVLQTLSNMNFPHEHRVGGGGASRRKTGGALKPET